VTYPLSEDTNKLEISPHCIFISAQSAKWSSPRNGTPIWLQAGSRCKKRLTRISLPGLVPSGHVPGVCLAKTNPPFRTKDGGTLRTILDARSYMLTFRKIGSEVANGRGRRN
jgi:hypothetical protein